MAVFMGLFVRKSESSGNNEFIDKIHVPRKIKGLIPIFFPIPGGAARNG
jgi:hypothetical protein